MTRVDYQEYKERQAIKKEYKRLRRKQNLMGLACIAIGAITIPIEWDITGFVFMSMLGLFLMIDKQIWVD